MSIHTLSIRDAKVVTDEESGVEVFHVNDPHALLQAAGYFKFVRAGDHEESVYFRGQGKLYDGLVPTLFRGCNQDTQAQRQGHLGKALSDLRNRCRILQRLCPSAVEPLLQHYGLKTSWVDVVDNVWVALWFACHKPYVSGSLGMHLHFQRRASPSGTDYAYVLLVSAELRSRRPSDPGIVIGDRAESVDLRVAAPSIFLRPHSQHGLLVRMRGGVDRRPHDYAPLVRGIIRARLCDAIEWLGDGKMLGVHALFPPPFYDHGYGLLLNSGFAGNVHVGTIHHVGA